jgi:hypothetical protein
MIAGLVEEGKPRAVDVIVFTMLEGGGPSLAYDTCGLI